MALASWPALSESLPALGYFLGSYGCLLHRGASFQSSREDLKLTLQFILQLQRAPGYRDRLDVVVGLLDREFGAG